MVTFTGLWVGEVVHLVRYYDLSSLYQLVTSHPTRISTAWYFDMSKERVPHHEDTINYNR